MKFSIIAIVSLAVALICTSTSSVSGAAAAVTDDNKSKSNSMIISSSISSAAIQHDQIVRHSKNNKMRLLLQENTTCTQAFSELHGNNTQLSEAVLAYGASYTTIMNFDDSCSSEDFWGYDTVCDFRQTESIVGQEELETACTDLGAKVVTFKTTVTCNVTGFVQYTSIGMLFPVFVACFPVDCEKEESVEIIENIFASNYGVDRFESEFYFANVTSAECGISDTKDATKSGAASVGFMTMLSVLIMAVLSLLSAM